MIIATVIIIWIICGILVYGGEFAYRQRKFPDSANKNRYDDQRYALLWSLFGPITLLVLFFEHGYKYGFKWR